MRSNIIVMIKPITSQRSLKAHTMDGLEPATKHERPVLAGAPPLREHQRLPSPRPEPPDRSATSTVPCSSATPRHRLCQKGCSTQGWLAPLPRGRDAWERRHRPPRLGQAAATQTDLGQVGAGRKSCGEREGKRIGN